MRCQWGTSWENMKPWIAARRFKEFSFLDTQLRDNFPQYRNQLLPLPEKKLIGHLDSDVVRGRQIALELYMTRLVESMTEILSSSYMDIFLNMKNRITSIMKKIDHEDRIDAMRNAEEQGESLLSSEYYDDTPNSITRRLNQKAIVPGSSSELKTESNQIINSPNIKMNENKKYTDDIENKILNIDILVN